MTDDDAAVFPSFFVGCITLIFGALVGLDAVAAGVASRAAWAMFCLAVAAFLLAVCLYRAAEP